LSSIGWPNSSRSRAVLLADDAGRGQVVYPHGVLSPFSAGMRHIGGRLPGGVLSDLFLAGGFMLASGVEELIRRGASTAGLAPAALSSVPLAVLAVRRARPLLGLLLLAVAAAAVSVAQALLPVAPAGSGDVLVPILALLVMCYSLGVYGTAREVAVGIPQPLLLIVVVDLLKPGTHTLSGALPFFGIFIVGAPVLAGRLVRARHALVVQLRRQEREIDAERSALTGAALAVERLGLSGRLHETLVTGMESLVMQAATAQRSLEDGRAEPVASIEARAQDLLTETRMVVVSLASAKPTEAVIHDQPLVDRRPSRRTELDARRYAALPWAAIAAATVCVGLFVEIGQAKNALVPWPIALAGCFVIAAPITLSWSRPLLMTAALWALAALFVSLVTPLASTFTAISLSFLPPFAVAYLEGRGRSLVGLFICCLGELACFGIAELPGTIPILLFAWTGGRVLRDRSQLVEELRASNVFLAEQRNSRVRSAVLEERSRLARELHDAIGHSLTVIALHAGAARRLWESDRLRAEASLRTIYQVATEGLAELRIGFGSSHDLERNGSHENDLSQDVEELVLRARGTGMSVRLRIDTPEARLSAETELEAFRVLQEALTNVLKHAPGASADVAVRNAGAHVELVVANSMGNGEPAPAPGSGRGLRGMRERAEACGGRLDWSRRADGGFEVRAQFPALSVKA
jgi:signal transduction histidine kinase